MPGLILVSSRATPEWKKRDVRIAGIEPMVPGVGALAKVNDVDFSTSLARLGVVSRGRAPVLRPPKLVWS
jgi:hypothetical protein